MSLGPEHPFLPGAAVMLAVTISAIAEHLGTNPTALGGASAATAAAALFIWLIFGAFDNTEPPDDNGYGW